MTCWKPASRPGTRTPQPSLAADWTDVESFSRPPHHGSSALRRPRSVLGAPQLQPARPQRRDVLRLLPLGRHHGPRRNRPARPGTDPPDHPVVLPRRPGPRLHPRAGPHARRRHRARRHPRRLRLRPPRRRRLGPARSAPPARSWSRTCTRTTAAPRAPTPARSSPTATSTAPPPRSHCCTWARWPPPPPQTRSPPRTTSRPPNSPGTNSAGSPPTTPTATTASPAPPPRANSAARSARPR